MNPGKLNKRVTIQKIKDNGPLQNSSHSVYKTVWANISNVSGKEFIGAQSVRPYLSKLITIRYIRELDPSLNVNSSKEFNIKYQSLNYNIIHVNNIDEQNIFLELLVEVE